MIPRFEALHRGIEILLMAFFIYIVVLVLLIVVLKKQRTIYLHIKKSFDNLPTAFCFADENGFVLLCNRKMHTLSKDLLGSDLQNIFELEEALKTGTEKVQKIKNRHNLLIFPQGEIYRFKEDTIANAQGEIYRRIQAFEVTALYEKNMELKEKNQQLKELNNHAKKLYNSIGNIVREKEILAMKRKIHDKMGLQLLTSRQILQKEPTLELLKEAADSWKYISTLSYLDDSHFEKINKKSIDQIILELKESSSNIGVNINLRGKLPENYEIAYIIISAIKESTINTARHAKGTYLEVELNEDREYIEIMISNNGTKPQKEIVEGGGLSSLRKRIEDVRGTMEIISKPKFMLKITLPKKED